MSPLKAFVARKLSRRTRPILWSADASGLVCVAILLFLGIFPCLVVAVPVVKDDSLTEPVNDPVLALMQQATKAQESDKAAGAESEYAFRKKSHGAMWHPIAR